MWKSVYYRPIEEFRRRIKAAAAAGERGREPLQKVHLFNYIYMSNFTKSGPEQCTRKSFLHQCFCVMNSVAYRSRLRLGGFSRKAQSFTENLLSSFRWPMEM